MRRILLLVVSLSLSAPAIAQVRAGGYGSPSPGPIRDSMVPKPHHLSSREARRLECLRELRTNREVCLSRDEWRQVAERLSRGEPWR